MAEYIEREEIMNRLFTEYATDSKADVFELIRSIPAADVQPVRRGRWIELPKALNPNENPCKCSNCEHVLSFMNYYPKSNYCPNCGANMRGDENDCR